MGFLNQLQEPIFLKEVSTSHQQLQALENLKQKASEQIRKQIEKDIEFVKYGIKGEEQIAFELKNSHIPMYILHDLYFEVGGLSAQIDYLLITRKGIFVVECKNLFGDITINEKGDFIRNIKYGGKAMKEGIYSPVTQNKRHLEIIKALRMEEKKNILTKAFYDKNFYSIYHSVIVLANPRTILKDHYAPKVIKEQVIRVDQLINHIKRVNNSLELANSSDKNMKELALYFLSKHREQRIDYTKKYELLMSKQVESIEVEKLIEPVLKKTQNTTLEEGLNEAIETETLIKRLKAYRQAKSKEEQVKPYFIFSDREMMAVIEKMPKTVASLREVSGFGEVKCAKYGEAIIKILEG